MIVFTKFPNFEFLITKHRSFLQKYKSQDHGEN